jgi:hypothetical protein
MPTISLFYGIIIRMYPKDTDRHKLPHLHAYYNEHQAIFTLDGEILAGSFPAKQSAYVKAWIMMHEEDLMANWNLAISGEDIFKIEPLR